MKSARQQFILLGLICQALSWDDVVMPLLNTLFWAAWATLTFAEAATRHGAFAIFSWCLGCRRRVKTDPQASVDN